MNKLIRLALNNKEANNDGLLTAIMGRRGSGKSSIAGTLKGRTLMLMPYLIEAGSGSAKVMATRSGNELDIQYFGDVIKDTDKLPSLMSWLDWLATESSYDNVYIDSLSAVTDMLYDSQEFKLLNKGRDGIWASFRWLGEVVTEIIERVKFLTVSSNKKNAFFTIAVDYRFDSAGDIREIVPAIKGNVALSQLIKSCPVIIATHMTKVVADDGIEIELPELITAHTGHFQCRIDHVLAQDNPLRMEADLSKLVNFVKKFR